MIFTKPIHFMLDMVKENSQNALKQFFHRTGKMGVRFQRIERGRERKKILCYEQIQTAPVPRVAENESSRAEKNRIGKYGDRNLGAAQSAYKRYVMPVYWTIIQSP